MSLRFPGATSAPVRLESATGATPIGSFAPSPTHLLPHEVEAYHAAQQKRIGPLEMQRMRAERGESRETFVSFVHAVLEAVGHPEFEVGILSVTQALSRNAEALIVPEERPQLFLPMSRYGTDHVFSTNEVLHQVAAALTRAQFSDLLGGAVWNEDNYVRLYGDWLLELEQLCIGYDEGGNVQITNPFRARFNQLLDAQYRMAPPPEATTLTPEEGSRLLCEATGLSRDEVTETFSRVPYRSLHLAIFPEGYTPRRFHDMGNPLEFPGRPVMEKVAAHQAKSLELGKGLRKLEIRNGDLPLSGFVRARQRSAAAVAREDAAGSLEEAAVA